MEPVTIRRMKISDIRSALGLWRKTPGVGLTRSDRPDELSAYLRRNPGFSLVAVSAKKIAGAVLCGHDGRRGSLGHLAVAAEYRNAGLGRLLVDRCLAKLKNAGIRKCTIMVFRSNTDGSRFWKRIGWTKRSDIVPWQKET